MKKIVWLFIDIKKSVNSNGLLKKKNMDWLFDHNITNWKKLYWFTFQIFVNGTQYMMCHEMINSNEESFLWKP